MMHYTGSANQITETLLDLYPKTKAVLMKSAGIKGQMLTYQAIALYQLASAYNVDGATILEIGTFNGYSASVMAQAAPKARIITLNPKPWEVEVAIKNLYTYKNVQVSGYCSWDLLKGYDGSDFDMIFVDGDHNRIARDLPWYNHLRVGGLMLFHDYCPTRSTIVYRELTAMANRLEHQFDVYLFDNDQFGMVGFVKREGEIWPTQPQGN